MFEHAPLTSKERLFLIRRIAYLSRAGIPLIESLSMVGATSSSKRTAELICAMSAAIESGLSFSRALSAFPRTFMESDVESIAAGEASGSLPETLELFADELQKRDELRAKIVGAFLYPGLITLATVSVVAFMMLYLLPRIIPVFTSLHVPLPFTTQLLISTSTFLTAWWWLVLGSMAGVVASVIIGTQKSERFRRTLARVLLRVPVIGTLLRDYQIASICRTLGRLLVRGIPLGEGLVLTARATRHPLYRKELELLIEAVVRGNRLSTNLLHPSELFPPLVGQMVAVGERSGTLSETLLSVAEFFEAEVEERSRILTVLIEPVLMIGMGIGIGFIAISIIAPMYGITAHLHG